MLCQVTDHLLHPSGAEAAQPVAYPRLRRLVPAGQAVPDSIMVIESQQFCRFLQARASDQGLDCQQQGQPVASYRTGDLEWQVRLDQDRQLFDNLPRPGLAGRILPQRPAASISSTAASQPGAYGSSMKTATSGPSSPAAETTRAALPARSSRSRKVGSTAAISTPGGVVACQRKQAACTAAGDHADRDAGIGRDLSSDLGEPTVGHDQGCEQTPGTHGAARRGGRPLAAHRVL